VAFPFEHVGTWQALPSEAGVALSLATVPQVPLLQTGVWQTLAAEHSLATAHWSQEPL